MQLAAENHAQNRRAPQLIRVARLLLARRTVTHPGSRIGRASAGRLPA